MMQVMKTLIFESEIDCDVATLFDFHSDTHNLPKITPPGVHVDVIKLDPLKEGATAVLNIKKGLIGFTWHVLFEVVERPNRIVDVATRSPFKYFRHEHAFIPLDNGKSLLRDTVSFALPLEPLSHIIRWLIAWDIKKMFAYRHEVTRALLEKNTERQPEMN